MKWVAYLFVAALLLSNVAYALKIFPTLTDLGEKYEEEQSFILTVLNDGPGTEELTLTIDPESYYLEDYVKIEPKRFTLKSNAKKNIQITTNFPGNLSPEKHSLVILPMTKDGMDERTVYSFKVPGIARPDLRISKFNLDKKKDNIILEIELNNLGNVIGRASPVLKIYNSTEEIDVFNYESRIIVMPFSKYNLTLMYDSTDLPKGDYTAELFFNYNENMKTNSKETVIEISDNKNRASGVFINLISKAKYPIILIIILFLIVFSIKPEYLNKLNPKSVSKSYPKETLKWITVLDRRIERMEVESNQLVNQTQTFIKESNEWFERSYGKGTFEFK